MRRVASECRRVWRAVTRLSVLVGVTGCVYFNGIYNANEAARSGDVRLRRGNDVDAAAFFQLSAAKAESVLLRYPQSSRRTQALYLAGRGAALAGQCERAEGRLREFLTAPQAVRADRERARVALGACEVKLARLPSARARLDSLVDVADPETARQARLWAARAALAAGDRDAVARYLGRADDGALPWELLQSSLTAQDFVRVESLLVQRAVRADYRDDVTRAIRELWMDGRFDAVEHVVQGYDAARIRDANRAAMHFAVGELNLRAGRDSVARQHLLAARTLAGRDTLLERESSARIAFIALVRASTLREVDTVLARQDSAVKRTPFARRVNEQLLLVRLLAQTEEPTGASLYLAAEVARDSLRAIALSRTRFLRVAREMPGAPLAPQAWYAAGLLAPDSAEAWNARVRSGYPNSAVAAWLRGEDPASRTDFTSTPPLLQIRWDDALRVWTDSVRKLRTPPKSTVKPSERP